MRLVKLTGKPIILIRRAGSTLERLDPEGWVPTTEGLGNYESFLTNCGVESKGRGSYQARGQRSGSWAEHRTLGSACAR